MNKYILQQIEIVERIYSKQEAEHIKTLLQVCWSEAHHEGWMIAMEGNMNALEKLQVNDEIRNPE